MGIIDVKSWALSLMLEQFGLAPAERYVFTLRSRVIIGTTPFYTTIKRNFDPVTFDPTSYVNGTLSGYRIQQTFAFPNIWEAVEFAVDPLAPSVTSVSALADAGTYNYDFRGQLETVGPGMFYTGLTRDDVGGLRYLYRDSNLNVENIASNSIAGAFASPGGSTANSSPWAPVTGIRLREVVELPREEAARRS